MSTTFDDDSVQVVKYCNNLLEQVASQQINVSGMHFDLPATGRIYINGNNYLLNYSMCYLAII